MANCSKLAIHFQFVYIVLQWTIDLRLNCSLCFETKYLMVVLYSDDFDPEALVSIMENGIMIE